MNTTVGDPLKIDFEVCQGYFFPNNNNCHRIILGKPPTEGVDPFGIYNEFFCKRIYQSFTKQIGHPRINNTIHYSPPYKYRS